MEFTIKPATRQGIKPLIGFYAESGCGKTYSALLLARGFVGPSGKIAMVDSESGRGSLYADVIKGGYDTLQIDEPFSPARYIEAIQIVEKSGASIGIIDSVSHEWEGIGGVLDMAGKIEEAKGKGLHCWNKPKMEHAKFVQRMLRSTVPWIVCLRAKFKSRQSKGNDGKSTIIKDDFTTPIQADDFIFEMTAHGEIMPDHAFRLTKMSHPALGECFPQVGPITMATGEAIARWCANPMGGTAVQQSQSQPANTGDRVKALKSRLWKLCEPFRGTGKSCDEAEKQLREWNILSPVDHISNLTEAQLVEVIEKTEIQLKELEAA